MSTVSPELALVDPDLRAAAIAGLPSVSAYAFLDLPPVSFAAFPHVSRAQAAGVYFALALARTLAVNAVVVLAIAVLVLIINLFA